ncbi:MAG: hydroxymethylpyrimidine/phosphomethylpyrimidine kinase, partial [Actinobacteria bacterium]|nr:hydroxymethylpyrimidine/phosphomethylpyrimidine kinase [Actinomycetota bacterium]
LRDDAAQRDGGQRLRRALLIGGLDPSAGAGIIADAFVAARLGFAPCCVATTVTAQNSRAFLAAEPVSPGLLRAQLDAIAEDGPIDCVKIGAVASAEHADVIRGFLLLAKISPVVLDPVLASTSGGALFAGEPSDLFALAARCDLVTPNQQEAAAMLGRGIASPAEAQQACLELAAALHTRVLITGVRLDASLSADVLGTPEGVLEVLEHPHFAEIGDPRGTGCAFATTIALNLCLHAEAGPEAAIREAQRVLLERLRLQHSFSCEAPGSR